MSNLTSSQGHARSRGDPDRSCCMSLNASRQEKFIGTNPLLDLYSVKSYRQKKTHLTSYDLEWPEGEVMGSNLYMGHREWPDMRQSWDIQYDLPPTFEIKCIWTFSHCLITVWSENWPDLRSLKSKFRDSRFLGTDDLINSWKIHVDSLRTVATAQS